MVMKVKIATIAVTDFDNGTIMLKTILNSEHPSILAASISSCGIALKNCVNKKIAQAFIRNGKNIP